MHAELAHLDRLEDGWDVRRHDASPEARAWRTAMAPAIRAARDTVRDLRAYLLEHGEVLP